MKREVIEVGDAPNINALIDAAAARAKTDAKASTSSTSSSDEDSIPPIMRDLEREFDISLYIELKSEDLDIKLYKDELLECYRAEYNKDTSVFLGIDEEDIEVQEKYRIFKEALEKDYDKEHIRARLKDDIIK